MFLDTKLRLTRYEGAWILTTDTYTLTLPADRPYIYLGAPAGGRLAHLFALAGVHSTLGQDDTTRVGAWQVLDQPAATNQPAEVVFELQVESSLWQRKTIRLRCRPQRLRYELSVEGAGALTEVTYFGGYASCHLRWGSGFFTSGHGFLRAFNPAPNTADQPYFSPQTGATIGLTGAPLPGCDAWFFTPSPFCLAFESAAGWIGLGVEAEPGENRFSRYSYHAQPDSFYLSLAYEGQTQVNGAYQLPAIGIDFAEEPYAALAAHVSALRAAGLAPDIHRSGRPDWWRQPIFCGWGSQSHLAVWSGAGGRAAPAFARQEHYERFLAALSAQGVQPGTVILDDKWQASYGLNQVDEHKWPDLPGFIKGQHAAGRRVLLWLKAWDPEGLPPEACVTNASGLVVAADPGSPAYERLLRDAVRQLLSAEGYDADGFKIDFTARIPASPGLRHSGDLWGLELLRRYLAIVYDEAKRAKPDALVITHTPHPYLADVTDMIRLNDMNLAEDALQAMQHRAHVAAIACPQALIDTDNWPMTDRATWRQYLALQPQLGVPSLYFASHIDSTGEPLEAEDYRRLRQIWEQYRKGIQPNGRQPEAIGGPHAAAWE